jgi:hypothetical protein
MGNLEIPSNKIDVPAGAACCSSDALSSPLELRHHTRKFFSRIQLETALAAKQQYLARQKRMPES